MKLTSATYVGTIGMYSTYSTASLKGHSSVNSTIVYLLAVVRESSAAYTN